MNRTTYDFILCQRLLEYSQCTQLHSKLSPQRNETAMDVSSGHQQNQNQLIPTTDAGIGKKNETMGTRDFTPL